MLFYSKQRLLLLSQFDIIRLRNWERLDFNISKRLLIMSKTVNYTTDQVSKMIESYSSASTVESRTLAVSLIAKDLGKTVKSVIAKLSREGVYVKAVKVTKTGSAVISKTAIVTAIASSLGLEFESVKSLVKATKADLELISKSL